MRKVIVFGSLNMDMTIESKVMPKNGETIEGFGFITNAGGKGGNQAVASAKLGIETHMIARVGNDQFGDEIIKKLSQYGVNIESVDKSELLSTGAAVIIRCENDNRIILSAGANHERRIESVEIALNKIANQDDIFLTQLECDYDTTLQALMFAKEKGLFTIFNPAPAMRIATEIYKDIDIIIVNQTECELMSQIYPNSDSECYEAIMFFKNLGVQSVIITLGSKGSVSLVENKLLRVKGYKVEIVDTTAAGDAYIGALASSIVRGDNLSECMEFATKCAALTITKLGAQQALPYLNEVDEFFKEEKNNE